MSSLALLQSLRKASKPSERKSDLRRTHLRPRQHGHSGGKNYVWLRSRRGYGRCGRFQCAGRRRGGGGGVRAIPVGVIEVSDQQTRFVPISDRKRLAGALLAGIGLGMLLGWRRRC